MLKLYISLICCKIVSSQINGEFWWLHEKVAQLHNIAPPQPRFDDVSEFETDDSVKLVFRDDISPEPIYNISDDTFTKNINKNVTSTIQFEDKTSFDIPNENTDVLPSDKLSNMPNISTSSSTMSSTPTSVSILPHTEDVLNFVFPKDNDEDLNDNYVKSITSIVSIPITINNTSDEPKTFSFKDENRIQESESICTFIETIICIKRRGFPYSYNGRPLLGQNINVNQIVCCILPLKTYESSKIYFPDSKFMYYNRYKRSANNENENPAMKQRNALMRRKYHSQTSDDKTSTTSRAIVTQRIVTPEDYLDPYWNVKNSKFRNPSSLEGISEQNSDSQLDYSNQEYAEELPKPGRLVGLYSDHNVKGWTVIKPNKGFSYAGSDYVSEEDDNDFSFGYSTIDPRLGNSMSVSETRRKPSKIMILSPENKPNTASQIISFRSKPDFQVLQGFKLLNLARIKNRFNRKTPQSVLHKDLSIENKPYKVVASYMDNEDFVDLDQQIFSNCGMSSSISYNAEKDMSEVERGSNPWIALVVLTRSRQSILCYGTVVHPRAAVTAADCVHGTTSGEISIIAGIFDLSEDKEQSQHRVTTVLSHPNYKPGQLSHNLAILHWKRPLALGNLVQPACMTDPNLGDDCYFVGWGGYDDAIQQRPRWQKASILSPKVCSVRLTKLDVEMPTDAFCASVDSRGTVTGVGGPLLCTDGYRHSVVGVAVWRDSVILTLPVLEWSTRILQEILS